MFPDAIPTEFQRSNALALGVRLFSSRIGLATARMAQLLISIFAFARFAFPRCLDVPVSRAKRHRRALP
jgi:hypothetical protein